MESESCEEADNALRHTLAGLGEAMVLLIGLDYYFGSAPFDIFGEIVPILDFFPDVDFELEGAIGGRFWF